MKTKEYMNQPHIKEEIRSRFNYNPDTGQLTWATRTEDIKRNIYFNANYAGKHVGYCRKDPRDGYISISIALEVFGKRINTMTSRICWLCATSNWPENTIDHVDRDATNNKWENLRAVTQGENNKNKGVYKKRKPT